MLAEPAYAKINLALHVRRRRADGYHDIESLFAFAEEGDTLTAAVRKDGMVSLSIDGSFAEELETGPDNLVLRAAELLKRRHDVIFGADITLTKNLPIAAGIGGGSADAAAALRLLARLWEIGSDAKDKTLLQIAAELGSDVPACLVSRTLMGTGRGEALDPRAMPDLSGTPLLLVNPRKGLSTPLVFSCWDGQDRGPLQADNLDQIVSAGRNDLQPPAVTLLPEIGDVLAVLDGLDGVRLARMSGSGATCFALLKDEAALAHAAAALMNLRPHWWVMTSRVR